MASILELKPAAGHIQMVGGKRSHNFAIPAPLVSLVQPFTCKLILK